MKKVCLALVMVVAMAGSAWAEEVIPLRDFTLENIFQELERAKQERSFNFSGKDATTTCDKACVTVVPIETDTTLMITSLKKTKKVTSVNFIVALDVKGDMQIAKAMKQAIDALYVAARLVSPNIPSADVEKLQETVGLFQKGLTSDKEFIMPYDGVNFGAKLGGNGIYLLNISSVQK